jgi:GNAT superfamily N-acetyltransferase
MLVRPAAGPAEVTASGQVVKAAYAEFGPRGQPDRFAPVRERSAGPGSGLAIPGWDAYEREQVDAAARAAEGIVLVAVDPAATVVGTATLYLSPTRTSEHWRPDDAVVRFLAVLPAVRGRGVGAALLAECIRLADEAGRPRLALHTAAPMVTAAGMYRRAGFVPDPAGDLAVGAFPIPAYALELPRSPGRVP